MYRRLLFSGLVFALCLAATAYFVRETAIRYGLGDAAGISQERLRLISATLQTRIERFRYLPEVVARSRETEQLFEDGSNPGKIRDANLLLARIAEASGALALFVTDADGLTIAASNYDQPGSFVGQNYAYRPYFRNAVKGGFGSYYAVGATTGEPGYFLATPIRIGPKIVGVSIVKIDLLPVEQQWRDAAETVAMSDDQQIIFLSSNPGWRYTAIGSVSPAALRHLSDERRYGDAMVRQAKFQLRSRRGFPIAESDDTVKAADRLFASIPFGDDGWSLDYFADLSSVTRQANIMALAAALGLMLAAAGALIVAQQLHARAVARRMVGELEARVSERTFALQETNLRLEREIAERQEAENQLDVTRGNLSQAEKLAAIGQTFAGLAHEINQPLAALQTYISSTKLLVARRDLKVAGANFDMMSEIVGRVSSLTNQLKRLARRNDNDFVDLDLAVTVRRTLALLKFRFSDLGISIFEDMKDGLHVSGSETQLDQVVLNLLNNAIDAVRNRPSPAIGVHIAADDNSCVLTIDDNGPGIDPALHYRMFEPFHTTKAPGDGLGLGLATANRIVADHHGSLSFGVSPLGGARFSVKLGRVGHAGLDRLRA